jgi:serine protease Do
MKTILPLVIATTLIFLSCATPPQNRKEVPIEPAPTYSQLKMSQLRDLLHSDPLRALEAVSALLSADKKDDKAGLPSRADLEALAAEAIVSIETNYKSAGEAKDYPKAIAYLDSLRALGQDEHLAALLPSSAAEDAKAWRERKTDLLIAEADDFFAKGLSTPALLVYLSALEMDGSSASSFPDASLGTWAARALAVRDRRSLSLLCDRLKERSIPAPSGASAFLASRDSMATMRQGVVTIRVDKGIKIEQGLGTPDRVLGTGFYIDASGYVLTNYHVIASEVDPTYEGYSHMSVKPADEPEERIGAKVVGYDRLLDLAVLKVDTKPEYVFSFGNSSSLVPGQKILAVGSPVGLENTVTSGIVSASGRKVLQTGDAIQIDAALNPGNSGGPLIDETGNVVGVVFAGMPQYQGLNFAIPSEWVLRVLPDLFRTGEFKHAWLGLALADKESSPVPPGIGITYRHPSSAAGIEEGDRLIDIDGKKPKDIVSAQAILLGYLPESLAIVKVAKGGVERTELRCLVERPFNPLESAAKLDRKDRLFPALFGMSVTPMPGNLFESANYNVAKVWPGSIADEAGLSENDPISLRRFYVDQENDSAYIQIYVKKRKAGFLESIIQIPASLEIPNFI